MVIIITVSKPTTEMLAPVVPPVPVGALSGSLLASTPHFSF
jgi:hypothetical protein